MEKKYTDKTEKFRERLKIAFPEYEEHYEVLEYIDKNNIYVKNKYGICKVRSTRLYNLKLPTRISSLDKKSYFIVECIEKHGKDYDYDLTKYLNSKEKVTITCYKHGNFKQLPSNHLKYGCFKCGSESSRIKRSFSISELLDKFNNVHNYKYNYNFINYKNLESDILVTCPEHKNFIQNARTHLRGAGCPKCAFLQISIKSWKINCNKQLGKARFYVLKCYNESEEFYKVGITRFSIIIRHDKKSKIPYNYEVMQDIEGTCDEVWEFEKSMKQLLKDYKYKPLIKFNGSATECFKF